MEQRCEPAGLSPSLPSMAQGDPEKSGIYRVIRLVAAADFLIGLGFLILGPSLLGTSDYFLLGLGLAVIGAFIFVFFTVLAGRARRG